MRRSQTTRGSASAPVREICWFGRMRALCTSSPGGRAGESAWPLPAGGMAVRANSPLGRCSGASSPRWRSCVTKRSPRWSTRCDSLIPTRSHCRAGSAIASQSFDVSRSLSPPSSSSLPPVLPAAIAGVLDHLPAASLLLNPTINSYKRLVPGWFAPVNVSWGVENRSAAVRAIVHPAHPELCRLECRRPGADANPYLALSAVVASAADGSRGQSSPPPAVEGDAYTRTDLAELPGSLESALQAFAADQVLRRSLDERFSDYYDTSRKWELKDWQAPVARKRCSPTGS